MSSRDRLWHVLNAGLQAAPIDAAGEKRARNQREVYSDESEQSDTNDANENFSSADVALLETQINVNMIVTQTWTEEHRDFSHNFSHDKVPLVRYNRDWDILELRMDDKTPLEVELTGTLNEILSELEKGASELPPAFNSNHFFIHLSACQAAMYKRPELMKNMTSTVHDLIRNDGNLFLKLIFIYNSISEETGRDPIVYASDLNAMGISDIEIYRFWHQLRSLLSDLTQSKATSHDESGATEQVEIADFVSKMLREVDPRSSVLPYATQPMDW